MKKFLMALALTILCCIALGLMACDGGSDHEHVYNDWTVTRDPTCVKEGSKEAVCSICGKKTTRTIAKTGHDYTGSVTTIEPTCTEDGERRIACKNGCGEYKTEIISRTGHDYTGNATTIEPTCTEDGERRIACKNGCGKDKVTILKSLGHNYDEEGTVVKQPSCEEDGERIFICERCGNKKKETIDSLGHEYGDFEIDEPSSLTRDGQKSRHCTHKGCDSIIDAQILPKGEDMDYVVRVVRADGRAYEFSDELSAVVYDNGTRADTFSFSKGTAVISAKADRGCNVVIEGLRSGYTQQGETLLGRNEVNIVVTVKGAIVPNEAERAPAKALQKGDAMLDFVVRDTKSENKKFSELLNGKKGAYIFIFYVGCGVCATQFPVFVEEYNSYANRDDLLVIMLNCYSSNEKNQSAVDMENYRAKKNYPSEFYMASAWLGSTNVFDWVQRPYNGVPFSYFIDSEGIIDEIVLSSGSSVLKKQYGEVLSRYLGDGNSESDLNSSTKSAIINSNLCLTTDVLYNDISKYPFRHIRLDSEYQVGKKKSFLE